MTGFVLGFLLLFFSCSYQPLDFDELDNVLVKNEKNFIELYPSLVDPSTSFLFIPGGLVEPEAYINSLQGLCESGYRVIIVKVAADLAILDQKKALDVMKEVNDTDHWIVGGHSLGGVVAAKNISEEPEMFDGLVFLGSYPDDADDLSEWDGAVLSISAEFDLLSTAEEIEESEPLLPAAVWIDSIDDMPAEKTKGKTIYYQIEGGNHAQFGDYGEQSGDGDATITASEQHAQMVACMGAFFEANGW